MRDSKSHGATERSGRRLPCRRSGGAVHHFLLLPRVSDTRWGVLLPLGLFSVAREVFFSTRPSLVTGPLPWLSLRDMLGTPLLPAVGGSAASRQALDSAGGALFAATP